MGTPAQSMSLQVDSGSSEIWVNPVCSTSPAPAACSNFPRYTQSKSTSAVDMKKTFSLGYSGGSAAGAYVTDTFTIGSKWSYFHYILKMLIT